MKLMQLINKDTSKKMKLIQYNICYNCKSLSFLLLLFIIFYLKKKNLLQLNKIIQDNFFIIDSNNLEFNKISYVWIFYF